MLYSDYVTAVATLMAVDETITNPASANPSSDTQFNNILPRAIEDAELRMYRDPDFDFLATYTTVATGLTAAGSRLVALPNTLVVPSSLNLITPSGSAPDAVGASRIPLIRTSLQALDLIWPSGTVTATPAPYQTYWAVYDTSNVRIGPTPDASYTAEFEGTTRPAPLSATNTSTFLSVNLPDLFVAASLVYMSAYMKNFGASGAADDPQAPMTWERHYQTLKTGAAVEEARKKALSAGGTTLAPLPVLAAPFAIPAR